MFLVIIYFYVLKPWLSIIIPLFSLLILSTKVQISQKEERIFTTWTTASPSQNDFVPLHTKSVDSWYSIDRRLNEEKKEKRGGHRVNHMEEEKKPKPIQNAFILFYVVVSLYCLSVNSLSLFFSFQPLAV